MHDRCCYLTNLGDKGTPHPRTALVIPRGRHVAPRTAASPFCSIRSCMSKLVGLGRFTSLIGRLGSSTFRPSTASVLMSLTGSCFSSESAPGALPLWDSSTRRNNLMAGLTVRGTAGPSDQTNSPHPSSREGHHSTARWSSSFLLSHIILSCCHATAASRVQRNSVPSTISVRCDEVTLFSHSPAGAEATIRRASLTEDPLRFLSLTEAFGTDRWTIIG